MISYPRTLVCYCRFDTVFISIVYSYKYQIVSKTIPGNIVSWLGKTNLMPNNWTSRYVLRWMSVVWNSKIRNMVLLSTFGSLFLPPLHGWSIADMALNSIQSINQLINQSINQLTCFFVLEFFISLTCVWLEKTTIVYLYTIVFAVFIKLILRWIGSNDFK